jgi:hypothetical protein
LPRRRKAREENLKKTFARFAPSRFNLMPQPTLPASQIVDSSAPVWRLPHVPAGCEKCNTVFLVPPERVGQACPYCAQGRLAAQTARVRPEAPERLLPFQKQSAQLRSPLGSFCDFWLRPDDLTAENLLKRLTPLYWPMWLVDSDLTANWQAEAGFDYQVKSSRENYGSGQWQTQEVVETRIRWEPRAGQMQRHYDNAVVPGFSAEKAVGRRVGRYPIEQAQAFDPAQHGASVMLLPDLPPESVWPQAESRLLETAAAECQQAAGAQHLRNFTAQTDYTHLNWTLFLLPLYTTWYRAEDGQLEVVYVNGHSGVVGGRRWAAQKKGWTWGGILGGIAVAALLLAAFLGLVGALFPPALALAALVGFLALALGVAAIAPVVWAWQWNNGQRAN